MLCQVFIAVEHLCVCKKNSTYITVMTHTLQCAYYSKYRHKLNKLYLATLHWDLDVGTIFKYVFR